MLGPDLVLDKRNTLQVDTRESALRGPHLSLKL